MLILLMQRTRPYSVPQLAEELGVCRRCVYNYIDALNDAGFVVHTDHRHVRLENRDSLTGQLQDLLYFSYDEALTLFHAIDQIETNPKVRASLKQKLAALYGTRAVAEKVARIEKARVRPHLDDAIQRRRRALFVGYSSPNSNTQKDRLVEPFLVSDDGNYVWAFEVESMQNKVFRISRIGEVRVLDGPQLETRHHQAGYTDAFQMISFDGKTLPVRMRMNRRAYNLLIEEYPATERDITFDEQTGEWIYQAKVSSVKGIARFVLGLCDCITVETPELRSYVKYMAQKYILRLSGY